MSRLAGLQFEQIDLLNADTIILPFDCGEPEINNFLLKDAKNYTAAHLAATYIIRKDNYTLAYFSLLNDKITFNDADKNVWNKLSRKINNQKRRKSYPAIKIGMLGVHKNHRRDGYGTDILDFIEAIYLSEGQRSGCRFITVDAYSEILEFYERNGFRYMTEKDKDNRTRAMYYDLLEQVQ